MATMRRLPTPEGLGDPGSGDEAGLGPVLLPARRAAEAYGKSLRTWRTWDALGLIPQPIRIGRTTSWRATDEASEPRAVPQAPVKRSFTLILLRPLQKPVRQVHHGQTRARRGPRLSLRHQTMEFLECSFLVCAEAYLLPVKSEIPCLVASFEEGFSSHPQCLHEKDRLSGMRTKNGDNRGFSPFRIAVSFYNEKL